MPRDNADAAKGDVDKQVEKAEDLGYIGTKVDPLPNSAYSQESGPDSPPAVPDDRTAVAQRHVDQKDG